MRLTPSPHIGSIPALLLLTLLLSAALLFLAASNPAPVTAQTPPNRPDTPILTPTPTLPPISDDIAEAPPEAIHTQTAANQSAAVPRTEKVLAALIDFKDVSPSQRPFTRGEIVNLLTNNPDSLKNFIYATSRNKVSVEFDVLDWITVNKNMTDYPTEVDDYVVVSDIVSAMSNYADLRHYDKVMPFVLQPDSRIVLGCAAYRSPTIFDTLNGRFELGAAWLGDQGMACVWNGRIAHEFGHTFGFWHSLSIDCIKSNLVPGSLIDPLDENDGCGGEGITLNADVDMMGNDWPWTYEDFYPLHFQAAWQARAGWLTQDQVIVAQASGEYRLTTLESLTPDPKAIKIPVGDDHMENPQYYWLELRDYDNDECRVDIRLQANAISQGLDGWSEGYHTYNFGWTVRPDKPFRDPHRGILLDMTECTEAGTAREAVKLNVNFTQLDVDTPIIATFNHGETTSTLTNNSGSPIDFGSASIGGRNPDGFVIRSDECSNQTISSGASCRITVRYAEANSYIDNHGILKIPNSSAFAPQLTVSLYQTRNPSASLPDACVQHISPGSVQSSWNNDCVSATWIPIYNARFFTFELDRESEIDISVHSDEMPKIFLYRSDDIGGNILREGERNVTNLTLEPGSYTIEVTTVYSNTIGDFTLILDVDGTTPEPPPTTNTCVEPLPNNGTANGSWTDDCSSENKNGSYARFYTFTLSEASFVTITLESSLDTVLYLLRGAGKDGAKLCENDDYATQVGGAPCDIIDSALDSQYDSGIVADLAAGDYTIEATTYDSGVTGDFTLTVEASGGAAPPEPPPSVGYTSLVIGELHTCGLRADGSVVCWGNDEYNQVSDTPTGRFTFIAAGPNHTCGLRTDGSVVCWGNDGYDQVSDTPTNDSFDSIFVGRYHNCGIRTDGAVVCWGRNDHRQSTPP